MLPKSPVSHRQRCFVVAPVDIVVNIQTGVWERRDGRRCEQNRRQKVFNRGVCVSTGGLDIEILTKTQLIIVFHVSIWGDLELVWGR